MTDNLNLSEKNTAGIRKIAVMTSGGDSPGMNAAIRAVVRYGIAKGCEVVGIERGFVGLLQGQFRDMDLRSVANIIQKGGTILYSGRLPEFKEKATREKASEILKRKGVDALVVIGGDGSLTGAHLLHKEFGLHVAGIPATIDNDLYGTDLGIGFDTAINTAVEAIDRIRDTASSHERTFIVEVMGRDSGFIAMYVGVACGAETILVPERKLGVEEIIATIDESLAKGKKSSIIVVAEAGNPGRSYDLANELDKVTHINPRVVILGHIQRGGRPSARDRLIGSALGIGAVRRLLVGKSDFMVTVNGELIEDIPLTDAISKTNALNLQYLDMAKVLSQ